jgi:hypothetical protein
MASKNSVSFSKGFVEGFYKGALIIMLLLFSERLIYYLMNPLQEKFHVYYLVFGTIILLLVLFFIVRFFIHFIKNLKKSSS